MHFLHNNGDEDVGGIPARELREEIFSRGKRLLASSHKKTREAFSYPLHIVEMQTYNKKRMELNKAIDIAIEAVFAEGIRHYNAGNFAVFPEDYRILMDFIFQNQEIIQKKRSEKKRPLKFYEVSGEALEERLAGYQRIRRNPPQKSRDLAAILAENRAKRAAKPSGGNF